MALSTGLKVFIWVELLLNAYSTLNVFLDPVSFLEVMGAAPDSPLLTEPLVLFLARSYGILTLGFAIFFFRLVTQGSDELMYSTLQLLLICDISYSVLTTSYFVSYVPVWTASHIFFQAINYIFLALRLLYLAIGVSAPSNQKRT